MKKNVGPTDRIVRLVGGAVLLAAALFAAQGALQWVLGVVAVVLLATGTVRVCPAYLALGINTNRGR